MTSKPALPSRFFSSLSNLQYFKKIIYLEAACKICVAMCRFGCPTTCGILVLWPGIETTPSSVEAQNHNPYTAREVLKSGILTLPCASRILGMSMNFFPGIKFFVCLFVFWNNCTWKSIGLQRKPILLKYGYWNIKNYPRVFICVMIKYMALY